MADSPFTTVQLVGAEATFMLGADDDPSTIENLDAQVVLDDGSRWSATLLTLAEIARLMERWKVTGECLGGSYFQCSDLVVMERGGVSAAAELLGRLVESGQLRDVLVRVDR